MCQSNYILFSKFQVGCHVLFTQQWPLSCHLPIKAWFTVCCKNDRVQQVLPFSEAHLELRLGSILLSPIRLVSSIYEMTNGVWDYQTYYAFIKSTL